MNLDEGQKEKVRQWIEQGLQLAEIQSKLASEFGLRLTYMDLRFLLDDLRLRPKDKERPPAIVSNLDMHAAPEAKGRSPGKESKPDAFPETPARPGTGRVSVEVDQVTRPGALASGHVNFSDGKSAEWHLDQAGRLGLIPKQTGYKPSQQDLVTFQTELQKELEKLGY